MPIKSQDGYCQDSLSDIYDKPENVLNEYYALSPQSTFTPCEYVEPKSGLIARNSALITGQQRDHAVPPARGEPHSVYMNECAVQFTEYEQVPDDCVLTDVPAMYQQPSIAADYPVELAAYNKTSDYYFQSEPDAGYEEPSVVTKRYPLQGDEYHQVTSDPFQPEQPVYEQPSIATNDYPPPPPYSYFEQSSEHSHPGTVSNDYPTQLDVYDEFSSQSKELTGKKPPSMFINDYPVKPDRYIQTLDDCTQPEQPAVNSQSGTTLEESHLLAQCSRPRQASSEYCEEAQSALHEQTLFTGLTLPQRRTTTESADKSHSQVSINAYMTMKPGASYPHYPVEHLEAEQQDFDKRFNVYDTYDDTSISSLEVVEMYEDATKLKAKDPTR